MKDAVRKSTMDSITHVSAISIKTNLSVHEVVLYVAVVYLRCTADLRSALQTPGLPP
jgi:hypothetical protein